MTAPPAASIRASLPPDRERPAGGYPIDGATPALAFRPRSREEVAALLAAASEAGAAVAPQGGRTALRLGRPLARYDVALDLTALDRLVAHEPDDLTLTVEAGMTLRRLQELLAGRGQYLSVDPPPDDGVTVGGLLATARPGSWRGHAPAARDLVLGVTVALPDGTLARSGGRVVKNVSGYDLHRLHTGALGAFGVIVEASFKLAPLPAAARTAAARCPTLEAAEALTFDLWDRALPTRALALLAPGAAAAAGLPREPHVLVEFAGGATSVDRSLDALRDATADAGAAVAGETGREPWTLLRALAGGGSSGEGEGEGEPVVLRIGAPAPSLRAAVEAAEAAGCAAWANPAAGNVTAHASTLDAKSVVALRERAAAEGGFLVIESASPALRAAVDPFEAGERDLVRALKVQFDPAGTLNPGRWMEGV